MSHLPFEEARLFVHRLGLKKQKEWREFCKSGRKTLDIPTHPERAYKDQWISWGDWFGTGTIATFNRKYLDFEAARADVQALKLKDQDHWNEYCKSGRKSPEIPNRPDKVYKQQWKGFGDWLGTGAIATFNRKYLDFEAARAHVQALKLKDQDHWNEYCKSGRKPPEIPNRPDKVYKQHWKGFGDWLGTGAIATFNRKYLDFEAARAQDEWREYCRSGKKPSDIPANPARRYKKEWKGFGDWLGTGAIASFNKKFKTYSSSRDFVRGLGIKSLTQWRRYVKSGKKPEDIPTNPNSYYVKEWKSWGDFLGTGL